MFCIERILIIQPMCGCISGSELNWFGCSVLVGIHSGISLYNTDVITCIVKMIVNIPVGKLVFL